MRSPEFTDEDWETSRISLPMGEISHMVAIFESYDNHFLVRTEDRGLGLVLVWHPKTSRPLLDALLRDMGGLFPLQVLERRPGMWGLDEVFPP